MSKEAVNRVTNASSSEHCTVYKLCTLSVLGQEEGYTVKYTPSPEGVPKGTPEGEGYI